MAEKKKKTFEITFASIMVFTTLTWAVYNIATSKPAGYGDYEKNIACVQGSADLEDKLSEKKDIEKKLKKNKTKELQEELDEINDSIAYNKGESRRCLEELREYEREMDIEPYGLTKEKEKEIMSWDYYVPKEDDDE